MSIPIVIALLLAEAVILVAALFIIYKLQPKPKARTTIASGRKDAPGWVYEFVDPDTGVTVYVGQAFDVEKRVDQHLRASMSTGLLYSWIAGLVQQGKRPIVRKVAHGSGRNELVRMEQDRINELLADGAKLFNRQASQQSSLHLRPSTQHLHQRWGVGWGGLGLVNIVVAGWPEDALWTMWPRVAVPAGYSPSRYAGSGDSALNRWSVRHWVG